MRGDGSVGSHAVTTRPRTATPAVPASTPRTQPAPRPWPADGSRSPWPHRPATCGPRPPATARWRSPRRRPPTSPPATTAGPCDDLARDIPGPSSDQAPQASRPWAVFERNLSHGPRRRPLPSSSLLTSRCTGNAGMGGWTLSPGPGSARGAPSRGPWSRGCREAARCRSPCWRPSWHLRGSRCCGSPRSAARASTASSTAEPTSQRPRQRPPRPACSRSSGLCQEASSAQQHRAGADLDPLHHRGRLGDRRARRVPPRAVGSTRRATPSSSGGADHRRGRPVPATRARGDRPGAREGKRVAAPCSPGEVLARQR